MKTILIVDDELDILKLLTLILTNAYADLNIITAVDGIDALDKLSANDVDILFTDLNMPNMNGEELITAIKDSFFGIKIIHTAFNGKISVKVDKILRKPCDFSEIIETISFYINQLEKKIA